MNITDFIPDYKPLSLEEMKLVRKLRAELLDDCRNIPSEGRVVPYLGQDFLVYPNTFQPFEDSVPLVENFIINNGESVLDVGTGAGTIAIFAALKGAKRVLAVDVNPNAVRSAKENVRRHNLEHIIEVRLSNVFSAVEKGEKFDVVTGNLPFTNETASKGVAQAVYDPFFNTNKDFLGGVSSYRKSKGRVYFSQANFGNLEVFFGLAEKQGFLIELIGTNNLQNDPRIFYAFELKKCVN